MENSIQKAVTALRRAVAQLRKAHPERRFTLDGRLLGDIGEVLAETHYEIELNKKQMKHFDAVTVRDGRRVQIKATMLNSLTFPPDHIPELYLGLKIESDGSLTEVFNGPGRLVHRAIAGRKQTTRLHSISLSWLRKANEEVNQRERIPRRGSI